jgi:hypothetical protein
MGAQREVNQVHPEPVNIPQKSSDYMVNDDDVQLCMAKNINQRNEENKKIPEKKKEQTARRRSLKRRGGGRITRTRTLRQHHACPVLLSIVLYANRGIYGIRGQVVLLRHEESEKKKIAEQSECADSTRNESAYRYD